MQRALLLIGYRRLEAATRAHGNSAAGSSSRIKLGLHSGKRHLQVGANLAHAYIDLHDF